jgi:hypothetical protein
VSTLAYFSFHVNVHGLSERAYSQRRLRGVRFVSSSLKSKGEMFSSSSASHRRMSRLQGGGGNARCARYGGTAMGYGICQADLPVPIAPSPSCPASPGRPVSACSHVSNQPPRLPSALWAAHQPPRAP